ncbi:hypothetical protein RI129_010668 [Pyrocoelia pectoralis]|uniref:RING-type E3 ubiquitin transferase n=1 Tax=Pyrocoelia pectoralis TaxID=417401 RepID=A0AAN7ZDU3_9COLE
MFNIINCKSLLNELKCKQCSKFLSVLPVYYCSAIGNVCGRCISTVDWMISNGTLERAVAYEAVAKFLIFPCANYDNGCQDKLRVEEVEQHEKTCKAVPTPCPFNIQLGLTSLKCEWQGTAANIIPHLHAEHKDSLQVGLPSFVMNVYDTHVKNFYTTIDGQTFLIITKYLKDINKFYFTVMCCATEPSNQCYRLQLEIGRYNDYFLIFRKPNSERFGNVQDLIDNPENMISVDVASVLTMLEDPSGLIYCKITICKKSKKEIGEIMGKPDKPITPKPETKAIKPMPEQPKSPVKPKDNKKPCNFPKASVPQTQPVKPPKNKPNLPNIANLNIGETSKTKIPPLIPNLQPRNKFLEEFECPVCNHYMIPPIFICPTGHSLCNQCKMKLDTCPTCRVPMQDTRNFTLEKLTANVKYPCCYADYGCNVLLNAEHIKVHELHCNFTCGKCPLKLLTHCSSDDVVDVIGHMRQVHTNMYVETNQQYARDIGSKVTSSYWATSFNNEIFVICSKHGPSSTSPIKFNALHVGMNKSKQKYRFRIEFCDQTSNGLTFIISQLCKVFPQNPSIALKHCLGIPVEMLQPFIVTKPNPRLFFKLFIERM